MQSDEFVTIYDNAASLVAARCHGLPGLSVLLDEIRSRISCEEHNPMRNRRLIFEPRKEAQRLEVPQESATIVAEELHRLAIFHLWVRARCPAVDEGPDTVVETDSSAAFRKALDAPCPQCSQFHEHISWSDIDVFYAINFEGGPDKLDIRRLFRGRPTLKRKDEQSDGHRWRWWPRFSIRRRGEPKAEIASVLEANKTVAALPDRLQTCKIVWMLAGAYMLVSAAAFVISYLIWGPYIGATVAGIMVAGFAAASWMTLHFVLAAPLIQRMLVSGAFGGTSVLILRSHFDVDFAVSQNEPWSFSFKSQETDWPSIVLAGIIMGFGIGGACVHQFSLGWMQRK